MTRVDQMLESVLQGQDPLYVIESAVTPDWKPGERVPEGYRVVFGKLVRGEASSAADTLSTRAARATAHAKKFHGHDHEHVRAHGNAAHAHKQAVVALKDELKFIDGPGPYHDMVSKAVKLHTDLASKHAEHRNNKGKPWDI